MGGRSTPTFNVTTLPAVRRFSSTRNPDARYPIFLAKRFPQTRQKSTSESRGRLHWIKTEARLRRTTHRQTTSKSIPSTAWTLLILTSSIPRTRPARGPVVTRARITSGKCVIGVAKTSFGGWELAEIAAGHRPLFSGAASTPTTSLGTGAHGPLAATAD